MKINRFRNTYKIKEYAMVIILLFILQNIISQENYRRHFIIAYETSTAFQNSINSKSEYKNALRDIFNNQFVTGFSQGNQSILQNERASGQVFFDSKKDIISFFHFGVADSEFSNLKTSSETVVLNNFLSTFLKHKNVDWSTSTNIETYFNTLFNIPKTPTNFGSGYTLNNLVYPLVLNQIDQTKYAEEYVLILLANNSAGDINDGYRMDQTLLGNIFGVESPSRDIIDAFSDELLNGYNRDTYFEFSFPDFNGVNPTISIKGYRIKPNVGNLTEKVTITLNSEDKLMQNLYNSNRFSLSKSELKFSTENTKLKPQSINLKITRQYEGDNQEIFSDVIAEKDSNGDWIFNYAGWNFNIMNYDENQQVFEIPELTFNLDHLNNDQDFKNLKLEYTVQYAYLLPDANQLNYVSIFTKTINKAGVIYISKTKNIILIFMLPLLLCIIIITGLVLYGKPRNMKLVIKGYLDSFMDIDYTKHGKLFTPYKFWNNHRDYLILDGQILYKKSNSFLNWRPNVIVEIKQEELPIGFSLFLKPDLSAIQEFSEGYVMELKPAKSNNFSFVVGIRQDNINMVVKEPQLVKFKIITHINESKLVVFKKEITAVLEYQFHVGEDLGDVWVGLDPGTTGSCIAVGTQADNICLSPDSKKANSFIMPSLLSFDPSLSINKQNGEIPEGAYKFGTLAGVDLGVESIMKFQSVKKLLGYKGIHNIGFKNGVTLSLTGKDLSGLIIKGLYKELNDFAQNESNREFINSAGLFSPKRAVIAIPNNFTISKIQDIIDCVKQLKQFDEVRYVYESEAVLFYYLSHYNRFNPGNTDFQKETMLVFDMGGATINATIVKATKNHQNRGHKYNIDILGKIGYGIGGDTIDYCLIKFLLSFTKDYPELKAISLEKNKSQLATFATELKFKMVENANKNLNYLITSYNLQEFINGLGLDLEITEESAIYKYFLKDKAGKFKLFEHKYLKEIIYKNVIDAVEEVIELSDDWGIDKMILSGRSTFFPGIKETIEAKMKEKGITAKKVIFDIDESKTAVAMGACWYGINKNSIQLNNLKTNASFGIKHTIGPAMTNAEFIELVSMGCVFNVKSEGIGHVKNVMKLNHSFDLDGGKVNFYQIMGKDASKILSENQTHKYSKIASVKLPMELKALQMMVSEDDDVICKVQLMNNDLIETKGYVSDQEITDANAEHYTWMINNKKNK